MSFDEVFIGCLGLLVLVLIYNILIIVSNHLIEKNLDEDKILNLQIQLFFQQEKSFELIEKEKLLHDVNASLSKRIFKILKKIISLQTFIVETYH
ncbi:hypothetical protein SAMN05421824_2884 [Hyunsoonleella jejuensis]|uniref:Uncharacterized protein n=1 Tax=Hyunsoonleella jejuensis TaxID=419940 RepID=A0A1H9L0A4_9FLAO|nr:hypothetical protein [Hyunsoonleella jejuensis]SER04689.1 hypothetical protein SAMN05421824_2884 [Hyunsoonleella jejuensis]